jgi:hypothetical protein
VTVTITSDQWLNLAINALLPALVALVTAQRAHPGVKAVALLFLSAVSGLLTSYLDAVVNTVPFDWSQAGFTALSGFAVAVLMHLGLLSPLALTGANGVIQRRVPGGIGTPRGRHELRENRKAS